MYRSSCTASCLYNLEALRTARVSVAMARADFITQGFLLHDLRGLMSQVGWERRPPRGRVVLWQLGRVGTVEHVAVGRGVKADGAAVRQAKVVLV